MSSRRQNITLSEEADSALNELHAKTPAVDGKTMSKGEHVRRAIIDRRDAFMALLKAGKKLPQTYKPQRKTPAEQ